EALGAHKWLVGERLTLVSAIIAAVAPVWLALALLIGALIATYGAQALLRDRYEQTAPQSPAPASPPTARTVGGAT
ncbi:MAG TPA: hypothetical protein VFX31_06230, partial [Ktedonobacterales bacterium]|nr:hypothetical protein [Ktedonobacterales bacterium]